MKITRNLSLIFCAVLFFDTYAQNVIVKGSSANLTVLAGTTINMQSDLDAEADFSIANNGTLSLAGDLTNNSSSDLFTVTNNGLVELNGDDQLIDGQFQTNFFDLALGGIDVQKTMTQSSDVLNSLDLGDAAIDIQDNTLSILSPSIDAITHEEGFIQMDQGGWLLRNTNRGDIYEFPVGNENIFDNLRPVAIEPSSSEPASYEVGFYDESAGSLSAEQNLGNSIEEFEGLNDLYYHRANQTSGTGGGKVTLTGLNQDSPDDLFNNVASWDSVAGQWVEAGSYVIREEDFNQFSNVEWALEITFPEVFSEYLVAGYSDNEYDVTQLVSPNGDRLNDAFVVPELEDNPDNEVFIYNRWGNLVFQTRAYENDWAGIRNGKFLANGTYFYVVKIYSSNRTLSGFFELQRN